MLIKSVNKWNAFMFIIKQLCYLKWIEEKWEGKGKIDDI